MILPSKPEPDSPPALRSALATAASGKAQPHAAARGPLGTNAKSSSPLPADDAHIRRNVTRVERYLAQSTARRWLTADARNQGAKYPGNLHRTCACRYLRHQPQIHVMHDTHHNAAFYAGLVSCGSVWSCPVCAARIQERRRLEIEQAIAWAESLGLVCVLVTFTFPHSIADTLADLIAKQRDGFKRLRSGKAWMKVKPLGLIRSLELTYGDNGWHPHTHELWFCEPDKIPCRVRLTELWYTACLRAGLVDPSDDAQAGNFNIYAVDVKRDMTCGDYLAKQDDARSWGFSHEVAKATSKAGRRKGFHPHHLLVRQNPGDRSRFLEYHAAMKGARQLFWSPGLKAKVGITDVSDETIAEESREDADDLAMIPDAAWELVRTKEYRAWLLEAAETGGAPAVRALLASLGYTPGTAGTDAPTPHRTYERRPGGAPGQPGEPL